MAITEHNWLDLMGVKIVKDIMLNTVAKNILANSFTDVLNEESDNKHMLTIDILAQLLETINEKLSNLVNHKNEIDTYFTNFNVTPIIFFKGNPEDIFENPSDDFIYIQLQDSGYNSIWLWQKIKSFNFSNIFNIDNDGNLYINIEEEPDIAFTINESGDLILTTSSDNYNFLIEDDNLYFVYNEDTSEIGMSDDYKWICLNVISSEIENYWKKSDVNEIKNALYEDKTEYIIESINNGYIQEKINNAFSE